MQIKAFTPLETGRRRRPSGVFAWLETKTRFLTGFDALSLTGFTLVEILIGVLIFSIMSAGLFVILTTGQSTWYTTDVAVQLQQNLRQAMQRVTKELHESGFDKNGVCQVTIQDGGGANNTDILRFKVPVDWDNNGNVLDVNGDIEWGAPLHWVDKNPNCEGVNNNCQYLNYSIEYSIDSSGQFIRRVLDATGAVVRTDVFAEHLTDFQVTRNGNIVSITLGSQRNTVFGRTLNSTAKADVLLRNRG